MTTSILSKNYIPRRELEIPTSQYAKVSKWLETKTAAQLGKKCTVLIYAVYWGNMNCIILDG